MESAIQVGLVHDVVSLKAFVETSLVQAAQCDAIGLAHAHRALLDGNLDQLLAVDREIMNRKLNEESRLMTQRMGKLVEMTRQVFEADLLTWWLDNIKTGQTAGTFPVSQALVMGLQGISARNHRYASVWRCHDYPERRPAADEDNAL